MDINSLMKQAQSMQSDIEAKQKEVESMEFKGSANGLVNTIVKGSKEIVDVEISADAMKEDADTLGSLVVVAINDAINKAEEKMKTEIEGVTKGMKLPGLM